MLFRCCIASINAIVVAQEPKVCAHERSGLVIGNDSLQNHEEIHFRSARAIKSIVTEPRKASIPVRPRG
jgi:hypothetical protein